MTLVKAYAAFEAGGDLKPYEYELGEIRNDEVDISVEWCGLCHSDLSMIDNSLGLSQYPLVPGHEVIGRVKAVGENVNHLKPGDRVGLGWQAGYCLTCAQCMSGNHNLCKDVVQTIVAHHGGFADTVRAQEASVIPLPDGIDAANAGPLLCGGVTVFNPLIQNQTLPTAHIGIIGIGGLGHMAVKFCRAWGAHITAFVLEAQVKEAKELGAHDVIISNDARAIAAAANRFDLIISTVNVNLDWDAILATLRPHGKLYMLGLITDPVEFHLVPLILGQWSMTGSPVGAPTTIRTMLEFAARHNVMPITEHFPLSQVNEAIARLRAAKAHYRIVLDIA